MVTPPPFYCRQIVATFFAFLFFLLHLDAKKVIETKIDVSLLGIIINPQISED